MPVEVTVQNEANGSATVSIAGGGETAEHEVLLNRLDNQWPNNAWEVFGDRTGDGDVLVSPGSGLYWIAVESSHEGALSFSVPQYVSVTDGLSPVSRQIIEAAAARIRLLMLDGVNAVDVIEHELLDSKAVADVRRNTIVVAEHFDAETLLPEGPTSSDVWGYPLVIAMVAPANRSMTSHSRWKLWRQRIRHAFQNQALPAPSLRGSRCEYQDVPALIQQYWEKNLYASLMKFRVRNTELRGMGI